MLKQSIEKLSRHENLDNDLCDEIMTALLDHTTNDLQKAAFLVLLHAKRETPEELFSILKFLKKHAVPIETRHDILDIVGTGGDQTNTITHKACLTNIL